MTRMHLDEEFHFPNGQRKQETHNKNNYNSNKKDLKLQWFEMRKKVDDLVDQMDKIDIKQIKFHSNQIDKLCKQRNMNINCLLILRGKGGY